MHFTRTRLYLQGYTHFVPSVQCKRQYSLQTPPKLQNPLKADYFLRLLLAEYIPADVLEPISLDLKRFSKRIIHEIDELGLQAELEQPTLVQYSAFGERVDQVKTSRAWKLLKDVSAEEGLVAIPYEKQYGQYSRIHQAAKLHLFGPSSGLYNCPLAMTDGAAKLIQAEGISSLMERAFKFLTNRKPDKFWTSGQWMTEKMGGSDVTLGTETVAREQEDGSFRLYGQKWFTSAVDSNMAFTLARIQRQDGNKETELSLFYLETRLPCGAYNGIQVDKLKNKLGTRQLPTAELTLDGTLSRLIGQPNIGTRLISHMLNVTRIHNSLAATGAMRRIVQLASDYAKHREAFGKPLFKHPLHLYTLANLEIRTMKATAFAMDVSRLMGLLENGADFENNQLLLRILTPLLKLYTAKEAVHVISEGLECFGGQGYIEDTGLPRLLRDAQVLPIWEGTTNILSLDLLRIFKSTDKKAFDVFLDVIKQRINKANSLSEKFRKFTQYLKTDLYFFENFIKNETLGMDMFETASRDVAFSMCHVYIQSLFLEYACNPKARRVMLYLINIMSSQEIYIGGAKDYGEFASIERLELIYPKAK